MITRRGDSHHGLLGPTNMTSSSSSVFSRSNTSQTKQLFQMVGHVLVELALMKQCDVLLDELPASPQQEGDLSELHVTFGQLGTTREC